MGIIYLLLSHINEKQFKYDMWLCHAYMKMRMEDIYNLPVSDRKDFIRIHNKVTKEQNEKMKK